MITQEELTAVIQKCLVRRDDGRFYPTPAGCIRLQEMLAEKGMVAKVTISPDERFDIQRADEAPQP